MLSMLVIVMTVMMKLTKLRKRRKPKGMTDHQSRKTMMRAKAQMRKRALARKNGANLRINNMIEHHLSLQFLSDPGIPGVRSMGPGVSN